jgi:hypothetical protein
MSVEIKKKRTRNMGEVHIQQQVKDDPGCWIDVDEYGVAPFNSVVDASEWIEDHGSTGVVYRIVRVYPPVQVEEAKRRRLVPA